MSAYADKIAMEVLEADALAGARGLHHPSLEWHKAVALARAVSVKPSQSEAVERDAARYRWLRSSAYVWGHLALRCDQQEEDVSIWIKGNVPMDDAGMDAAVDAAMRQSAPVERK